MSPIYSIQDFLDMTKRRIRLILMVILLGTISAVIFALNQPKLYHSAEVIQIEQPSVAGELAPQTVEGSSARPLQLIQQKLLSRNSVIEIIEKYQLYSNIPALTLHEKIAFFRGAVAIEGVAAAREGFADDGTIAILSIRAEMDNPVTAQQVAKELADRTRAMSAERRQQQAQETLAFFTQQEQNVQEKIIALEREVEIFRTENNVTGEGRVDFRLNEISSLNASILELDRAIIEAQLARTQIDRRARRATVERMEQEIDAQLATLSEQRTLLDTRRQGLRDSLQTSPEVDRALSRFEREMDQLQAQLASIASRRNDAEVGFSLENASYGEQLTTLEEAIVPIYPVTGSRKRLAAMGAVASVFAAFVIAWILEWTRPVIRTAHQMNRETGLTPVVAIPEIRPPGFFARLRRARARRKYSGDRGRSARMGRRGRA